MYTENIGECKVQRGYVERYDAEIILNEQGCDFQAINNTKDGSLSFLPVKRNYVVSCEEFRGLEINI